MESPGTSIARRGYRHAAFPILLLVVFNLVVAGFVYDDYGESWDENSIFIYAENTVEAYKTVFNDSEMYPRLYGPFNLRLYGPFFFSLTHVFANWAYGLASEIGLIHFWHLGYFLAFQMAVVSFYFLCLRVMSTRPALGASLLFNSQPLLWGHAFINPKDIPFLAFFLASVLAGLWMADQFLDNVQRAPAKSSLRVGSIREVWLVTAPEQRRRILVLSGMVGLLVLIIGSAPISSWAEEWACRALAAGEGEWSFRLLHRLAPNLETISLATYLDKFALLVPRIKVMSSAALIGGLLVTVGMRVPALVSHFSTKLRLASGRWLHASLLPAGALLGLSGALRVIGPSAGGLVALYLLRRAGRRALPQLLAYFSLAALVTFMFWPFLWAAPLANLGASLNEMANFPKDIGVRFNGEDLRSGDLPASYLPVLVAIQLTEPVLFLALGGMGLALWRWRRGELTDEPQLSMMALWFLLPFLFIVIVRPTFYDNFRQVLFVLPPLFLFAGLVLEYLAGRLPPMVYGTALLLLLAPGVLNIMRLHPYEYVYYNSYVGGLAGASGRYELDYWATSYREGIEYLNEVAPLNAAVFLRGPDHVIRRFGRADLVAAYELASQQTDLSVYEFAVLTTRFGTDEAFFPDGEIIHRVEQLGVTLAVVKQMRH